MARMELDLIGLLEQSASAPASMDSPVVVEDGGVGVRLELSLGFSSDEVEFRKGARESNEAVVVKKPKMEEGPMPYCLQVMPTDFIEANGHWWVPISMEVVGNNLYMPRDNPSLALETDGVAAGDWLVEVAGEFSSPESLNYGTSVLQLFS